MDEPLFPGLRGVEEAFDINARTRRPIRLKVLGIALVLLVLMLAVTAFSAYNLRKVNNEVRILSDYYIPIEQNLSRVEVAVQREVIRLERMIALSLVPKPDARAMEVERLGFAERGTQAHNAVEEVGRLIGEGLASSRLEEDRAAFARLRTETTQVAAAHESLQATVASFLAELAGGSRRSAEIGRAHV